MLLFFIIAAVLPLLGMPSELACTFADAENCLRDRAVLIVGTSVSRHWFFELQSVLTRKKGSRQPGDGFVEGLPKTNQEFDQGYRERKSTVHTVYMHAITIRFRVNPC